MKPRHLFRICHKNGQLLNGVDTSSHISKRVWDEVVQKRQNDYVIDTTHIQCPFQSTRRIYDSLNRHQPAKHNTLSKSLFIGGDHSMSIATLAYSLKKLYQPHDLKVIWIDAHADINTYEKSETKNLHGTPLAYATLIDVHPLFQNVFTPWYSIRPENILYIGLRDLDSYENELINDLQIKRITCKEINKYPEIQFVYTGKQDSSEKKYIRVFNDFIKKNDLINNIVFTGFISREEQIALMINSKAIIQPSLFEGWNTSIEDCKSLGLDVIASDIKVHREQLGKASLLFNKNSEEDLANLVTLKMENNKISNFNFSLESESKIIAKKLINILK